jgi:hypothetical protein
MTSRWNAEVTNDPENDFELCVDLREDDARVRGTIRRDGAGGLVLRWYPSAPGPIDVPVEWLRGILDGAARDL